MRGTFDIYLSVITSWASLLAANVLGQWWFLCRPTSGLGFVVALIVQNFYLRTVILWSPSQKALYNHGGFASWVW